MSNEKPILFKDDMIRAILEGRKTQTRRIMKPQPHPDFLERGVCAVVPQWPDQDGVRWYMADGLSEIQPSPFGKPGDRLIVSAPIEGFAGKYAAGSDGVIYSRARGDWRPLSAHPGSKYPSVTLVDGSRKTTRNVHSLVCRAFYGPPPTPSHQVRHIDGDRKNSEPGNLCWGTQAENWSDRKCHGNGVEGEKHHAAKLSNAERAHVRWAIERGLCSQRHAARTLGMTQGAISQMMVGCETGVMVQDIPGNRIPRITLEITGVRVERLQDISEADAKAEGVEPLRGGYWRHYQPGWTQHQLSAKGSFATLWDSINGPGSWDANPWVWVIEFKRIDQEAKAA